MDEHFRRTLFTQLGIVTGIVITLAAAIWWFAADVHTQRIKVVQDRTLIRERSAAIAVLAELKRNAPRALQYESKLNAFLPTQEQLLDFPRTLGNLARVRRLTLNFSFRGGQVPPRDGAPGTVSFDLDVAGMFEDILGFLHDVEVEPPRFLARFNTFDIVRNGEAYRLLTQGDVFFR